MKRCQSCGRLIELLEDFAGLEQSSQYCSSCADDSGKLMSFEEVLENLTQRIAKTDGFDESASRNAALQILGTTGLGAEVYKGGKGENQQKKTGSCWSSNCFCSFSRGIGMVGDE